MENTKKTRTPLPEKGKFEPKLSLQLGQSKTTPVVTIPKLKERNVSVSFVNIRRNKEQSEVKEAIVEKLERREETQVTEIDLETPGQSLNEDGKKMNE